MIPTILLLNSKGFLLSTRLPIIFLSSQCPNGDGEYSPRLDATEAKIKTKYSFGKGCDFFPFSFDQKKFTVSLKDFQMIPTFLFTAYLHCVLQNIIHIFKKNQQFL